MTEKSLGQVAHEAIGTMFAGSLTFGTPIPWADLPKWKQEEAEDMASAVAAVVPAMSLAVGWVVHQFM